jgi:hypothetical protein
MVLNQQAFRHANERLYERVSGAGVTDHRHVPFLCECAADDCLGRINATLSEFEEAHAKYSDYFILPGHRRIQGEVAIEENGRYEVVTKEDV